MPRGRRRSLDATALEEELNQLKQRQADIRSQLRRLRNSQGEIRKLEEKLQGQLASAKWTVGKIKELRPEWDELGFYETVRARQPAPRGRRRRTATAEGEPA
jgi:chromosome segregation ATPase